MSGLDPVDVDVVVGEHGTAHRSDAHGFLGHAHLVEQLSHKTVHHAMAAARAVVCMIFCKKPRTGIYLVLRLDNIFGFHFGVAC